MLRDILFTRMLGEKYIYEGGGGEGGLHMPLSDN
jgi:hypothetical protein